MVKVRSTATMYTALAWEGEVPDDIPADERWLWIKENVDGGDFFEINGYPSGDWEWGTDVKVIKEKNDD